MSTFLHYNEFILNEKERLSGDAAIAQRAKELTERIRRTQETLKNAEAAGKKIHAAMYKEKIKYYQDLLAANNSRYKIQKLKDAIEKSM